VGFAVILAAWGAVAGEPDVTEQLPMLLGLGFGGLGLVVAGSVALASAVAHRDAGARREQLAALAVALDAARRSTPSHAVGEGA
jgi:hypothetical protein